MQKDEQVLDFEEESVVSCWPLVCASAKKSSHKGLNIDKLTTRPVIRTGEKKEESVGWLSWLLGIDLSFYTEEVPEEEEDEESANSVDSDADADEQDDSDDSDDVLKKYIEEDFDDIGPIEQLSEEELYWYSVKLLGDEDWFSVDLLGPDYDNADGRDWWEVDLMGGASLGSWLSVNMFGMSGGRAWYEVNWLGGEEVETKLVCADIDHDSRAWYEISWLGFCNDGVRRWYEVDFLSKPVIDQGFVDEDEEEEDEEPSMFNIDLLGDYHYGLDHRNWYEVDLYREPIIPEIEADQELDQDTGFESIHIEEKEEKEPEPTAPPKKTTTTTKPVKVEKPAKVTEKPTISKEEKKVKEPEPTAPPKKTTTTAKPAKQEKPVKVKVTDKPQTPKQEKKPKEPEPTVTPKKVTTTKAPKEIKEQKVVKPIIEKKGPKKPTEDEKAKMAEVPIPSQKTTAKTTETKPDIDSSDTKKLVAENNNVVAYICEYNLPFLGMLLCLSTSNLCQFFSSFNQPNQTKIHFDSEWV